jgi:hypothetical protein
VNNSTIQLSLTPPIYRFDKSAEATTGLTPRGARWLREFYLKDKASKKVPSEVKDRLLRKLQLIDDATCDLDLRLLSSNHFEKLR